MTKKKEANSQAWEEVEHPWYLIIYDFFIYRIWYWIGDVKLFVKGFFQRGRRGYAKSDLWSFDTYLSKVIGEGVLELAKHGQGWPSGEFKTYREWKATLNKMGKGFLNYHEKVYTVAGLTSKDTERLEESLELFKKHFLNLWD